MRMIDKAVFEILRSKREDLEDAMGAADLIGDIAFELSQEAGVAITAGAVIELLEAEFARRYEVASHGE